MTGRPRGRPRKHPATEEVVETNHRSKQVRKSGELHSRQTRSSKTEVSKVKNDSGESPSVSLANEKKILQQVDECRSEVSQNRQELHEFKSSMESRLNNLLESIGSPRKEILTQPQKFEASEVKVLRKFRPPLPRWRLREQALLEQAQDHLDLIVECDSNETNLLIASVESMFTSHEAATDSCETNEQTAETLSKQVGSQNCKFRSLNAWLARKQANWCIKSKPSLALMLKKEALISTYKCMAKVCCFTTISSKFFKKHLEHHERSSIASEFLLYCPYCFFKGDSSESLVVHYDTHVHDKFQCGFCFYRSASNQSCWEHCLTHHSRETPIIYECPLQEAVANAMFNLRLEHKRKQNVSHLQCTCCAASFYHQAQYESHLRNHAASVDKVEKESVAKDLAIYETKIANNEIGLYECLFCNYGTANRGEVRSHMQEHPKELVFIGKRQSLLTEIDPSDVSSVPIIELPKRADIKVIQFACDLNELRNFSQIENIHNPQNP